MKNSTRLKIVFVLVLAIRLGLTSIQGAPERIATADIMKKWENTPITEIKTKAEAGVPEAQFVLGMKEQEKGKAVGREASGWMFAAVSHGENLTEQEEATAKAKWGNATDAEIRSAADKRDRGAQWILGHRIYSEAEKHLQGATGWLEKAADQNYSPAEYELGGMFFKVGEMKARHWFGRAAEHGHEGAQHCLARILLGDGEDIPKAVGLLQKAADQGCALAKFDLAQQYACGNGEPRHSGDTPLNLIRYGATNDLPEAKFALAERFRVGANIRRDILQAITWYRLAYDLTLKQRRGDDTDHFTILSSLDANDRVRLSIEDMMGVVDDDGSLLPNRPIRDVALVRVLQLETKALDLRDPFALFQYAELFEDGVLTQRDPVRAYYFYSLAARGNAPNAATKREALKSKLTNDDLKQVQSWTSQYDKQTAK